MASPESLAGVTDLADWLGEPIPEGTADAKRAEACLRVASALVRSEAGRTWLDEEGHLNDVPEEAVMVALYCAGRVYSNRDGQTRMGIDDYTEAWKVEEAGAYLTASEKRMLAPLSASAFGSLGVIGTTRGDVIGRPSGGWVPTGTPGVEFPWY